MWNRIRARRLAGALVCAACSAGPVAAAPTAAVEQLVSPAQLKTLGVQWRPLARAAASDGLPVPARVVLPPQQDRLVSAPLDGVVEQLLVAPMEPVRAGQPLLRLLSPAFTELQQRLREARSRAMLAARQLEREQQLANEGIVPSRRVLEAQATQETAAAALRQVEALLRLAGADPAALSRGEAFQTGLVLHAPGAGWITALDVRPGQRVREADALLRVAQLKELWLELQVPVGTEVPVGSQAVAVGRELRATVRAVAPLVGDGQTQTVRAQVTRGGEGLRPGETLPVRLVLDSTAGWLVPLQAVTHHEGRAHVFVRTSKGFVATPVTVLASAGQSLRIQGTLAPEAEIAVSSVVALKAAWLGRAGGE